MTSRGRTPDPLTALEQRITRLEKQLSAKPAPRESSPPEDARRYWMLERLRAEMAAERDTRGRVGYAGAVMVEGEREYRWQGEARVADLLEDEWGSYAASLGALGHPMRLALLRSMIAAPADLETLRKLPGMGTSGQIYHHLRALQSAGWVRLARRNAYQLVPDRVIALLVIVAATLGASTPVAAPRRAPRVKRSRT